MHGISFLGASIALSCFLAVSIYGSSPYDKYCVKDGNVYYPGDCDKYISCKGGVASVESCGWFYRFDENTNKCIFHLLLIGNVNCTLANGNGTSPNPTPTSGTTTTTPKPNGSTTKKSGATLIQTNVSLLAILLAIATFKYIL